MAENLQTIIAQISEIAAEFNKDIQQTKSRDDTEQVKVKFLSRKGVVQNLFVLLGTLENQDRPRAGAELNRLKNDIQNAIDEKLKSFQTGKRSIELFDPTLPGKEYHIGSFHPLLQVLDEIKDIFVGMGFRIEEGNEIETDYHNFEALNIPPDHPSRDMHDTFYMGGKYLLRTHTSPVQIHTMEQQKPPIRMIAPGKCYRKDTPDASHSPIFNQVEGLCVDKGVSFGDLKGVVQAFAQKMFGKDAKVRFRPSFFPFTEPSAEYDFSCFCKGKGCRVCKNTGWLEISGAGMVDPAVFGFVDYDPQVYSGYAFGMGVERIAMLKYRVNDIRIFYENDVRFLEQF
ncbi:phenylalanine--tRNA ligase subunit alpha [candidate division KSB1 bacterium]|nr:phenylalanine--tRNA ligase subunit alpha [candidate division KSB1 bacterium]